MFLRSLRLALVDEASHVQGFMHLLMKPRNGMPRTAEEQAELRLHLKHIAHSLPVVGIFTLPGGTLLLPLLALILERRRRRQLVATLQSRRSTERTKPCVQGPTSSDS
jgi:hypothetical protein